MWNSYYIFTDVMPFLKDHGMADDRINDFVETNPHNFLAG